MGAYASNILGVFVFLITGNGRNHADGFSAVRIGSLRPEPKEVGL
jgi:hypothetical protein